MTMEFSWVGWGWWNECELEVRAEQSVLKQQERVFLYLYCPCVANPSFPLSDLQWRHMRAAHGFQLTSFTFPVAGGAPDGPAFPVPALVSLSRHPGLQEVLPAPPGPGGEVAEGKW